MILKKFNELRQGETFRFNWDAEGVVRTAQQVGKTEIYCPRNGDNTMGHSMAGGEEVYSKSSQEVIIIPRPFPEVTITIKNCPLEVWAMFESAYVEVPKSMGRGPLEITGSVVVDFNEMPDPSMPKEALAAIFKLIMVAGYSKIKQDQHEGN